MLFFSYLYLFSFHSPTADREQRAKFIHNKYKERLFIPQPDPLAAEDAVSELLEAVQTDGDLMKTIEIFVTHNISRSCTDASGLTPVAAAKYGTGVWR